MDRETAREQIISWAHAVIGEFSHSRQEEKRELMILEDVLACLGLDALTDEEKR